MVIDVLVEQRNTFIFSVEELLQFDEMQDGLNLFPLNCLNFIELKQSHEKNQTTYLIDVDTCIDGIL